MTTSIRIEASTWGAIRAVKKNRLKIREDEIRARGIGYGGIWLGSKGKIESVNPWLYI
jgi:hypothetical protein